MSNQNGFQNDAPIPARPLGMPGEPPVSYPSQPAPLEQPVPAAPAVVPAPEIAYTPEQAAELAFASAPPVAAPAPPAFAPVPPVPPVVAPVPPTPAPVPPPTATLAPEPLPVAAAPIVQEQPATAQQAVYRVFARLASGERVEIGALDSVTSAKARAQQAVSEITAGDGWPFFGGRCLRPDTIVSIDVESEL